MNAFFLLNAVIGITTELVKYTYWFGKYLIYGSEKTVNEKIDKILTEYVELKTDLIELKEILKNRDTSGGSFIKKFPVKTAI
jgi:hypothetical protein